MSNKVGEELSNTVEKAVLVAAETQNGQRLWNAEDSLDELAQLAGTAGIEVEGKVVQRLPHPNPAMV